MAAVAEASGPDAVAAVVAVVAADPGSDASRAGKRRRSRKGCKLTKSTRRAKEELYGHEIAHDIQETPKRTRPPGKAAGQGCPAGRTQAGERSGSWGRFVGRGLGLGRRFDRGWRRRSGTSRAIRRQRPASRGVRDRKDLEGGLQSARGFSPASAVESAGCGSHRPGDRMCACEFCLSSLGLLPSSLRQCFFDRGSHLRIVGLYLRFKAGDYCAILAD